MASKTKPPRSVKKTAKRPLNPVTVGDVEKPHTDGVSGAVTVKSAPVLTTSPNADTPEELQRWAKRNDRLPALLVAFPYLEPFLKMRGELAYRDWCLDSGAFSADNAGITINLDDYIARCKDLMQSDPTLTEIMALDVINDWRSSIRNCERMWQAGIPAVPCYHVGEPEHALMTIAREFPKIAIGGMSALRGHVRKKYPEQVFARLWPKKIHGFGVGGKDLVDLFPWHSVDATSWRTGPCNFGTWYSMGKQGAGWGSSIRGGNKNLRREVEHFMKLEKKGRLKWHKQMEQLETIASKESLCLPGHKDRIRYVQTENYGVSLRFATSGDPFARRAFSPIYGAM